MTAEMGSNPCDPGARWMDGWKNNICNNHTEVTGDEIKSRQTAVCVRKANATNPLNQHSRLFQQIPFENISFL